MNKIKLNEKFSIDMKDSLRMFNHIKTTNDEIEKLIFDIVYGKVTDVKEVADRLDKIRMEAK